MLRISVKIAMAGRQLDADELHALLYLRGVHIVFTSCAHHVHIVCTSCAHRVHIVCTSCCRHITCLKEQQCKVLQRLMHTAILLCDYVAMQLIDTPPPFACNTCRACCTTYHVAAAAETDTLTWPLASTGRAATDLDRTERVRQTSDAWAQAPISMLTIPPHHTTPACCTVLMDMVAAHAAILKLPFSSCRSQAAVLKLPMPIRHERGEAMGLVR